MADIKISTLPAITPPLDGTELVPIVKSTATEKALVSDIEDYIVGNLNLEDLANVTGTPTDEYILQYNGTTNEWEIVALAIPLTLNDLTDVNTGGLVSGDVLTYDGTFWVPQAPTVYQEVLASGTNIKTLNSGSLLGAGDIVIPTSYALNDLDDVSGTPSDGQVLTYDTVNGWQPETPVVGATSLDHLSDVEVPTPTNGQVLTYNSTSSKWEAAESVSSLSRDLQTESTASRSLILSDVDTYIRFTFSGDKTLTINSATGFSAPSELVLSNRSDTGNLSLDLIGISANPPKGGSTVLEPGDTVTLKFISSTEIDLYGTTADATPPIPEDYLVFPSTPYTFPESDGIDFTFTT